MEKFAILGMSGSLRKDSFNTLLLKNAQQLLPPDTTLEIVSLADLPLFNQDLEATMPAPAQALKEKVKAADAILIATPEYNYSFSGVLKNALDWISRPYGQNSMDGKPVAIMGASGSLLGTVRAQAHLRQVLHYLNTYPLNKPEVLIASAQEKFDANGILADEKGREKVRELLTKLVEWTRKLTA